MLSASGVWDKLPSFQNHMQQADSKMEKSRGKRSFQRFILKVYYEWSTPETGRARTLLSSDRNSCCADTFLLPRTLLTPGVTAKIPLQEPFQMSSFTPPTEAAVCNCRITITTSDLTFFRLPCEPEESLLTLSLWFRWAKGLAAPQDSK